MGTEDKMTVDERRKYLGKMKHRYKEAAKKERSGLLDEMEQVTEMSRKGLIRLLNSPDLSRKPRRKQRGNKYGPNVDDAIRVIAESLDYVCAERLKPVLAQMAKQLAEFNELLVNPELIAKLETISIATVGRRLRRIKQDTYRLPRKGPQRTNQVARDIPMGRIPWNEDTPGHFEVDTVYHCGPATIGEYVHTLQMVDVATGWSERVAVLGRSQREMEVGFRLIRNRLPISVIQLHMDNGSEFLNDHIIRCWKAAASGLDFMRSRAYQKNDNRFIEQKNATLVRAYLGQERLDTRIQCQKLNELYDKMWLYYNFFQPVMKLKEKQALEHTDGTFKVKHRHDIARTPFDRLCNTTAINKDTQEKLSALRDRTNPRQLRRDIYHGLDDILSQNNRNLSDNANENPGNTERPTCQAPFIKEGEMVPVTLSFD
jgi:hypothetical protein